MRDTMRRNNVWILAALIWAAVTNQGPAAADAAPAAENKPTYAAWKNGPGRDPTYFPIAVWLQSPRNAAKYKALGVNLYIGLWKGPTAEQIAELKRHDMPVICEQNNYALEHLSEKTIVGWMHGDEPDNAQPLSRGKGYGPPIPPESIVADYQKIKAKDATRPVLLNLGQGVAWDRWHGRGVRANHPEDYPKYVLGGDIVSFDIYPAVHDKPAVAGKLWYVAKGVQRLRQWTGGERGVWNCIECTRISNERIRPTPHQVKAEVWMSVIHGSQGLVYFCHQFKPRFIEAGLLADEEMAQAVGAINRQIHELGEALHSPTVSDGVSVRVSPSQSDSERSQALNSGPIATMVKRHGGAVYLFAVRMEGTPAKAAMEVRGLTGKAAAEVLGEDRTIDASNGRFADDFGPYAVHLYKIRAQ